nr:IS630 family transposase [Chelativorans sp. J32]
MVGAIEAGESCRSAASRFGVAVSSAVKWHQRYRDNRLGGAGQDGWPSQARSGAAPGVYRQRINQASHLTLHGLKDELAARGVKVSHDTVWKFLRREGLRFKKTLFPLEQDRRYRPQGRRWRPFQVDLDPRRLVFIDETWIKTNMAPLRGWGPKGKRLRGYAPDRHWRTLTFLGALRCDRLTAPCVFDGPINGQCFRAYVEQQLVPVLEPGDIVVMDNLGSHKAAAIRQMIRAANARLWYLPPYSPDLNPIEQALAKIKHWMRQAQKRTIEDTWRRIGHLVSSIHPTECRNYFLNAG